MTVEAFAPTVDLASPLHGLALAGRGRALREGVQDQSLAKLAAALPGLPRVNLPMLFVHEFKRAALESLSQAF